MIENFENKMVSVELTKNNELLLEIESLKKQLESERCYIQRIEKLVSLLIEENSELVKAVLNQ